MSAPRAMLFTRRDLLSASAAAAAAAMLPPAVYASDFHRFKHGAFDITVVSDGFITLPAEILLPDATPEERQVIIQRLGGDVQGAPVQANIPLIRYGDDLMLVDNGLRNELPGKRRETGRQPQDPRYRTGGHNEGRFHPCPSRSLGRDDHLRRQGSVPQRGVFRQRGRMELLDRQGLRDAHSARPARLRA